MGDGFDELFSRLAPSVHAYLARLTGDASLAEDLCQETFVRYLRHQDQLAVRNGHVAPWLFRVATNLGVDRLRRRKPLPLDGEPVAGPAAAPATERSAVVRAALDALEPDLRAIFLLRAHHGLTFPQLAEVLALSERGAKDRFRRARDELARRLAPFLEDLLP
jgi:RNA polymerase sigma-70 factor (ECF subfamily)